MEPIMHKIDKDELLNWIEDNLAGKKEILINSSRVLSAGKSYIVFSICMMILTMAVCIWGATNCISLVSMIIEGEPLWISLVLLIITIIWLIALIMLAYKGIKESLQAYKRRNYFTIYWMFKEDYTPISFDILFMNNFKLVKIDSTKYVFVNEKDLGLYNDFNIHNTINVAKQNDQNTKEENNNA